MAYEQIWVLIGVVTLLGLVAAGLGRLRLRQSYALQRRQWIHEERMKALEQGTTFHDMPPDLQDEETELPLLLEARARWVDLSLLTLGLLLAGAGAGMIVGLSLVPRTPQMLGMQELAPLGAIPLLAGIGLVLARTLLRRERRRQLGPE